VATVDVPDHSELLATVLERQLALQIEDGLPLFVIPVRPPARVLALRREGQTRKTTATRAVPLQP